MSMDLAGRPESIRLEERVPAADQHLCLVVNTLLERAPIAVVSAVTWEQQSAAVDAILSALSDEGFRIARVRNPFRAPQSLRSILRHLRQGEALEPGRDAYQAAVELLGSAEWDGRPVVLAIEHAEMVEPAALASLQSVPGLQLLLAGADARADAAAPVVALPAGWQAGRAPGRAGARIAMIGWGILTGGLALATVAVWLLRPVPTPSPDVRPKVAASSAEPPSAATALPPPTPASDVATGTAQTPAQTPAPAPAQAQAQMAPPAAASVMAVPAPATAPPVSTASGTITQAPPERESDVAAAAEPAASPEPHAPETPATASPAPPPVAPTTADAAPDNARTTQTRALPPNHSSAQLRRDFNAFLASRPDSARHLTRHERSVLFHEYLAWRAHKAETTTSSTP